MKRQILSIIIGITLLSLAVAGVIATNKTINIDDKLDISNSIDKYGYVTKYYSDGRNVTLVYRNETGSKCSANSEGKMICLENTINKRVVGFAYNDEDIKRIIERDITIESDRTNPEPIPTITKEEAGKIILNSKSVEGGIAEK